MNQVVNQGQIYPLAVSYYFNSRGVQIALFDHVLTAFLAMAQNNLSHNYTDNDFDLYDG